MHHWPILGFGCDLVSRNLLSLTWRNLLIGSRHASDYHADHRRIDDVEHDH
jgi:hypothetical protein